MGGTMRAVDECRAGEGRCIMGPGRGPAGGRPPPAASWACLDVHEHKGAGRLAAHPATAEAPSRPWDRARSGRAAPGSMTCRNLSTGNACRQRSLCRTCPRAPARLGKGSGQGTRAGRMWTPAPVRCSALCLYNMMTFSPPSMAVRLPGMPRSAGTRVVLARPGARAPILPCAQPHAGLDTWQRARRACRC